MKMNMSKSDRLKTMQLVFKVGLGVYILLFIFLLYSMATSNYCSPLIDDSQNLTLLSSIGGEFNILKLLILDGFVFLLLLYIAMVVISKRNNTHKKHGKFLVALVAVFLVFMFGLLPISEAIRSIIPINSSEYCSLNAR